MNYLERNKLATKAVKLAGKYDINFNVVLDCLMMISCKFFITDVNAIILKFNELYEKNINKG